MTQTPNPAEGIPVNSITPTKPEDAALSYSTDAPRPTPAVLRIETPESMAARKAEQVQAEIDNRFTFHPVKDGQPDLYGTIRGMAKEWAEYIVANVPAGREQSLALTKIEEAGFWANAGIARNS